MKSVYQPEGFDIGSHNENEDPFPWLNHPLGGWLRRLWVEHYWLADFRATTFGEIPTPHGRLRIPRLAFRRSDGGTGLVRLGIFAGFGVEEIITAELVCRLAEMLLRNGTEAYGYDIRLYPICHPASFAGVDKQSAEKLLEGFWSGAKNPTIYYLEREIGISQFNGIIVIRSNPDRPEGICGSILRDQLLGSVLSHEFSRLVIDPSDYRTLTRNAVTSRLPFEVTWNFAPGAHLDVAARTITSFLGLYRGFLSLAQNL